MASGQLATIHVRRKSRFGYSSRKLRVLVDGIEAGWIGSGGEALFDIEPGRHILQVQFWLESPSEGLVVDIQQGETVRFECEPKSGLSSGAQIRPLGKTVVGRAVPRVERQQDCYVLEEVDFKETTEVLGSEEIPLDNSHGTSPLSIEYEVAKTLSTELTLDSTKEFSGGLELSALSVLKAKLSTKLATQVSHVLGETQVRRHMLRFTVEPGRSVVYVVTWKRKTRSGRYAVMINGKRKIVPYRVSFDLSYDIRTR